MEKTPEQIDALVCIIIVAWVSVGVLIGSLSSHVQRLTYELGVWAPDHQVRFISLSILIWPLAYFIYRHYKRKCKVLVGFTDGKSFCQDMINHHRQDLINYYRQDLVERERK